MRGWLCCCCSSELDCSDLESAGVQPNDLDYCAFNWYCTKYQPLFVGGMAEMNKSCQKQEGRYRPGIDQECIKKWRENIACSVARANALNVHVVTKRILAHSAV